MKVNVSSFSIYFQLNYPWLLWVMNQFVCIASNWRPFLDCKEIQPVHPQRKSVLNIHWKDWCWSWNSNTLATLCKELTHFKRPWCWERLGAEEERDNRGWDGWMASPTRWTWVWTNTGSWWWTGRPGMLRSMGSQRVGHDWATELSSWKMSMISFSLGWTCQIFMSAWVTWGLP